MKMKFNWGTGIAVFYTLFMVAMVSMVIKSTYHKVDLVEENYYDKDLNYEAFRLKRQNASNLPQSLIVEYGKEENEILVRFPGDMNIISGEVALFCPSDKTKDQKYPILVNDQKQMDLKIPDGTFVGKWYVQVDWKADGVAYYQEQIIVL